MDVRELIIKVRKDNELLEQKTEELQRFERLCEVSGISFDEKTSATPNPNKNEENYLNCISYRDELKSFINGAVRYRSELMKIIDTLDDNREIKVMYMYCLESCSKAYIAKNMNYTKQRIHQMYNDITSKLSLEFDEILTNFNS